MTMMRGSAVLRNARRNGWALAAFSVYNLEQALAVSEAAAAEETPVLLQAGSSAFAYAGREPLAALAVAVAESSDAAVGVHLDHATDMEEIEDCLAAGYGSVMYDGSSLPLALNIVRTRAVVALAHEVGAWVEGELAGVAGDEDLTTADVAPVALTDPFEAERFVAETGVDALAVAIGNVHGIPTRPVSLDFHRLEAISQRVDIPLVLHGASGLSDEDIQRAIGLGVVKVNVNTELRRALREGLLQMAIEPPSGDAIGPLLDPGRAAVCAAARSRIRAFRAVPTEMMR